MGGTFVRRGQGLAQDKEILLEEARKGKHRSFADRLGLEYEVTTRLRRLEPEEANKLAQPAYRVV